MKRFYYAGLLLSVLPLSAYAWDAPTMGWSSWNSFGHRINEEIIRSQADAMVNTGLLDAGYKYVNIDDGAWCGRDEEGHLRIHHSVTLPRVIAGAVSITSRSVTTAPPTLPLMKSTQRRMVNMMSTL